MGNAKYRELTDWLRNRITTLPVGSKIESENDLTTQFGYSRQTVRHALEVLESEGLIRRTRGSGTYTLDVRRRLANTQSVAVLMTTVDDYIFPRLISSIERVLRRNGYTMQLMITHNRVDLERNALQTILAGGVDAVIAEPVKSALPGINANLYQQLGLQGLPCLFVNAWYPDLDLPKVVPDDRAGGRLAVDCLARNGHQQIGAIFKADDLQGHLRYQGSCEGLLAHGLAVKDNAIIWFTTEELDDLFAGSRDGYFLGRLAGCTGLICYNDQIAVRMIALLARHGIRCPDDISLISFDDSSLALSTAPGLSSLAHPKELLGEQSAERILRLLENPDAEVSLFFEPRLIERGSVKNIS